MSTAATQVIAAPLQPAVEVERGLQGTARTVAGIAQVAVPIAIWFAPMGIEPHAQHAFAIMTFALIGWMTQVLEPALTGLLTLYLAWALGVVPFNVAFAGFSNTTPWFLYGALLFGGMAAKTGLARRLAFNVMERVGGTYSRLLLGLIISDFLLTILVPSGIARVVLMSAVAIGIMEVFGVGRGSNIGRGMFVTLTYTATIFDKMIIAGAASITARGLIERVGNVEVLWSQWALAFLPVDLITIILAWRVTVWLYPPERELAASGTSFLGEELRKMGPTSAAEVRSAVLMLAAVALWATDFIHHIPSPMIGLGVGLVAVLPRLGVLTMDDMKKMNYLIIFFVGACISTGEILRETGALKILTDTAFAWLEPFVGNAWISTTVLYWTAFFYHIFLGDEISMLATSIPVLMQFAHTHGIDPLWLGMIWTFGAGGKIFVYQTAVLVVGYSYGYFTPKDLLRMGFILTVIEFFVLLLVVPLWWPFIGIHH